MRLRITVHRIHAFDALGNVIRLVDIGAEPDDAAQQNRDTNPLSHVR